MSRWLLALLLTAAGVPLASARDALTVIDACIARLDPALDVTCTRVAQRCPELSAALAASPWAPWLPPDWDKPGNELSAASLRELRALLTRPAPSAGVRLPRVAQVAPVLAGLKAEEHAPAGWWARFKHWLRQILTQSRPEPDQSWLRRLFGGLPRSIVSGAGWAALLAVLGIAIAIVVNELRVAGLLGVGARAQAPGAAAAQPAAAALTLERVQASSPAQQPGLLLELVIARLRQQERLPPARALTVRELERAARLPDAVDRERLALLAAACERVRYAAQEVPAPVLASALARGRELLAALDGAGVQPAGAG